MRLCSDSPSNGILRKSLDDSSIWGFLIQVVKMDCGKAKPQLLNQVEGTSLSF